MAAALRSRGIPGKTAREFKLSRPCPQAPNASSREGRREGLPCPVLTTRRGGRSSSVFGILLPHPKDALGFHRSPVPPAYQVKTGEDGRRTCKSPYPSPAILGLISLESEEGSVVICETGCFPCSEHSQNLESV
jgi:hypothetical protein